MKKVDVTIVGAGPAGAALGLLLAKSGIEVAILDRENEFNSSPKGAMFHPSTLAILEYMDVLEEVKVQSEIISGAEFYWQRDLLFDISYKNLSSNIPYGLSINYYHLQKTLIDKSKTFDNYTMNYGCEIMTIEESDGKKCISYKQDNQLKEINTSLVVAADGRESEVRESFGIEVKRWDFDHENLIFIVDRPKHNSNKLQVYRDERNYIISVPISKQHLLLLYAIPKGALEIVKEQGIQHIKEAIIKFEPSLKEAIDRSSFDWPKFSINYQGLLAKEWVQNLVLLIGDSAHSMHSLGGQGMNFSLQDAVTAAKVIKGAVKSNDFSRASLIEYEEFRKSYVEDYVMNQRESPILKLTGNDDKAMFRKQLYNSLPSLKTMFEMHLSSKPEEILREADYIN